MKPQARESGLLVRNLGGEVIVYDLDNHAAHCLNPSAAAVFERCDARHTVGEIVRDLREELGPEVDEQWVGVALEGLADAKLLGSPLPQQPSRRELLRKAGLGAALLLPAIISTVAPTPAEAANTCIPQASCTSTPQPCWINSAALDCPDCSCSGSGTCFCP